MRYLPMIAALACLNGCGLPNKVHPCPDEISSVVLTKIYGTFPSYNYLDIWLSHDYSEATWQPKLDSEQKEIDRLRIWSRSLADPCVRDAYAKWLDYYQRELDSAWDELCTQKTKQSQDRFDEQWKQQQERERQYSGDVPAPPKAVSQEENEH